MHTILFSRWFAALLCCLWLTAGALQAQNGLNDHLSRASDKQNAGDLAGAIAEYTQAIKLAPKMLAPYVNRANLEHDTGNLAAALADLDQAIVLDPKDAELYYQRAVIKGAQSDVDGAIADHTRAIELDPALGPSYSDRGLDKVSKGDLAGAVADCDKGVSLDPTSPEAFRARGIVNQVLQRWPQAAGDYGQCCKLTPGWGDYARFYLWLVRARIGQADDATKELAAHLDEIPKTEKEAWTRRVADFLVDRTTEADFLAQAASPVEAEDRGHHCEAFYFAGMKALAAGNKAAAVEDFRKCLATNKQSFTEYEFARYEMKVLAP